MDCPHVYCILMLHQTTTSTRRNLQSLMDQYQPQKRKDPPEEETLHQEETEPRETRRSPQGSTCCLVDPHPHPPDEIYPYFSDICLNIPDYIIVELTIHRELEKFEPISQNHIAGWLDQHNTDTPGLIQERFAAIADRYQEEALQKRWRQAYMRTIYQMTDFQIEGSTKAFFPHFTSWISFLCP